MSKINEVSSTQTSAQSETLISVSIDSNLETKIEIDAIASLSIIVILAFVAIIKFRPSLSLSTLEIDQAEFGLGKNKIKLRPNNTDRQIAYKIWVELSTRKIGLPVDFDNDVIIEIYNSWYSFFAVTRDLIKEVPATKIRRNDTEAIIQLSIDVLNSGIRPHLTLWQAKFRRWYEFEIAKDDSKNLTPQEIQKKYPEYVKLVSDLKIVNLRLINYRDKMHDLVIGNRNRAYAQRE